MPYVYLIQPVELVGTNRFKVGMSSLSNLSRVRSYKKGSRYLFICECVDALFVERKVLIEFNQNYKLIGGREYFEVADESEMINRFIEIVMTHKSRTQIVEPVVQTIAQADWMKRFAFKAT